MSRDTYLLKSRNINFWCKINIYFPTNGMGVNFSSNNVENDYDNMTYSGTKTYIRRNTIKQEMEKGNKYISNEYFKNLIFKENSFDKLLSEAHENRVEDIANVKILFNHGLLLLNTFIRVPKKTIVIVLASEGQTIYANVRSKKDKDKPYEHNPMQNIEHIAGITFIRYLIFLIKNCSDANSIYLLSKEYANIFKENFRTLGATNANLQDLLDLYFEDDLVPDCFFGHNDDIMEHLHDWKDIPDIMKSKPKSFYESACPIIKRKLTQTLKYYTLGHMLSDFEFSRNQLDPPINVLVLRSCRSLNGNGWPVKRNPQTSFFFKDLFHKYAD